MKRLSKQFISLIVCLHCRREHFPLQWMYSLFLWLRIWLRQPNAIYNFKFISPIFRCAGRCSWLRGTKRIQTHVKYIMRGDKRIMINVVQWVSRGATVSGTKEERVSERKILFHLFYVDFMRSRNLYSTKVTIFLRLCFSISFLRCFGRAISLFFFFDHNSSEIIISFAGK